MKITVKQARVGADMTQEEMARKLGVATSTYRVWEKSPDRISYENIMRITNITGVEISDLKMGANQ